MSGSSWAFFRPPRDPVVLTFRRDGTLVMNVTPDQPDYGRWEVIEPSVVAGKLNGRIFLYRFHTSYRQFAVRVFDVSETAWKGGKRIK